MEGRAGDEQGNLMLQASTLREVASAWETSGGTPGERLRDRPLILIVDDDPQVLLLAQACLDQAGFEVIEATSGSVALGEIASRSPDLVLCDVVMPGMDGFDVCSSVRELPSGAHVPVVMMTGLDDVDSIERAYATGATEFLLKPLNWTLLPRHVRFILKASKTQEALRKSRERYALAAHGANDGLWDWNMASGEVYYSHRWNELLGVDEPLGELGIEGWFGRIHPNDESRVRLELDAHLNGLEPRFESEHRLRHGDGAYLWVLMRGVAVRDEGGDPARIAGSITDISARKHAQAKLEHNAMHDALTDLPNRSLFIDRLTRCIRRARREPDERFAVLYMDLDRFKVVNDSLGHFAGDRLLVDVSRRVSAALRSGETLARLGGDEFAVLVEEIGDEKAPVRVAERIQRALAGPAGPLANRIVTSASIGITLSRPEYELAEEMLRDADIAMYAAKGCGRGHVEIFDSTMHVRAVRSLEMERSLREAIEGGALEVDYQPIVSLADGTISGFEALVRWTHPTEGRLSPDGFLDIALDTGLVIPMGRQVLVKACRQLKEWQDRWSVAHWFISVNLSAVELLSEDLVATIDETLAATGLAPSCLKVEVTERSVIDNVERAKRVMTSLRERGIRLSVDDFGTGFSSFSYLQQLPFDVLKIDRSFVAELEGDEEKTRFLQAIVSVAHQLGLEVVAEGSESTSSIAYLKALRCEYVQGNLLSRALRPQRLAELLDSDAGREFLGKMQDVVRG